MRQVHHAAEKAFVDCSGQRPLLVDPRTGECTQVELFVMVLRASHLTYVEAPMTQRGGDFIASHMRALDYIGGVSVATVCDQLRSGVDKPRRCACGYGPERIGIAVRRGG